VVGTRPDGSGEAAAATTAIRTEDVGTMVVVLTAKQGN
jgi:hypothetical protein